MAIKSWREVLPRTFNHRFGSPPSAAMKFAFSLDGPTANQAMLDAVGYKFGSVHPEYPYLYCVSGSVNEQDYYHAELNVEFGVPDASQENDFQPNPLARQDEWSFSSTQSSGPTSVHFPNDSDNQETKMIANSAGDPIWEGVTSDFGELKASIKGNRATFDIGLATQVTGCINSDAYLGAPPRHWQCNGIAGSPKREVVDGVTIKYWEVTVELTFRPTGYLLYLGDVGLDCMEVRPPLTEKKKYRCRVLASTTPPQFVDCSESQPLNPDGSQRLQNTEGADGWNPPTLLPFRVHREVAFAPLFGVPS